MKLKFGKEKNLPFNNNFLQFVVKKTVLKVYGAKSQIPGWLYRSSGPSKSVKAEHKQFEYTNWLQKSSVLGYELHTFSSP